MKESELDVLERNYDSYAPNTSLALIKNNLENSQWYHDNFFKFEVNLVPFVSALGKQSLPYPKDGKNRKTTYNEYIEICQLLSELNKTSIFNVHNEEEAQTFIYNCDSLCHNLGQSLLIFELSNEELLKFHTDTTSYFDTIIKF